MAAGAAEKITNCEPGCKQPKPRMSHLKTQNNIAEFDFSNSIIKFDEHDNSHTLTFREASQLISKEKIEFGTAEPKLIEISSAIIHEMTHYLDTTTTLWGREFMCRKNNSISSEGTIKEESLRVLDLNVSEIIMHSTRNLILNQANLLECTTNHILHYDESYGAFILIGFFKENSLASIAPISMLSVLECNALSEEFLFQLFIAENNYEDTDFHKRRIEEKFNKAISNQEHLEYGIFHYLTKIHLPEACLKSRLIFVSHICNEALNMNAASMSSIANTISYTIQNQYIGNAICNDMRRGMSRHIIAFKLILMTYDFINKDENRKKELLETFEKSPTEILNLLFADINHNKYEDPSDLEFDCSQESLTTSILEPENHAYFIEKNRLARKNDPIIHRKIKYYLLPDILLGDGTAITMPNRATIDMKQHFEKSYLTSQKLKQRTFSETSIKFHMEPGVFFSPIEYAAYERSRAKS